MTSTFKSRAISYITALKNPARAIKAYYTDGGRKAIIDLLCFECMGGSEEPGYKKDVANCVTQTCPSWCLRPGGKNTTRDPGVMPSLAELKKKVAASGKGSHFANAKDNRD